MITAIVSFSSTTGEQNDAAADIGIKLYSWNETLRMVSFLRCYSLIWSLCQWEDHYGDHPCVTDYSLSQTISNWLPVINFKIFCMLRPRCSVLLQCFKTSTATEHVLFFWFWLRSNIVFQGKEYPSEPLPPQPHNICTIMYTSGTSGNPKGVVLTHESHATYVKGVDLFLNQFEDKVMSWLSSGG